MQAFQEVGEKRPYGIEGSDAERNSSSEVPGGTVEKSRYCLQSARTVDRHRWMRRES